MLFSDNRNTIYVYNDVGVSDESLKQTILTFKKFSKKYTVKTINAEQIKNCDWTHKAALFIIPGGADVHYAKKLNGKGNEVIKKYVQEGGRFLGICAGAYYASSYVEFDKGGELEVLGERELRFFPGKAIGPILAPYDYKTNKGARAAKIITTFKDIPQVTIFYNGGGYFKDAEKYPNTTVIATYENNLPAIIMVNLGNGKVLLSGVHLEYDPYELNLNDKHLKSISSDLISGNKSRYKLINVVLTK
jgi:glutamine amidotransferase-like uncharacterized protein